MAATSFRGVEVFQNYKWGYVCEHCGKTVEKRNNIATKEGANYKGSTWTYISPVDLQHTVETVKRRLPAIGASLTEEWEKGNYPNPVTKDGVCPLCKKRQHWDLELAEFEKSPNNLTTGNYIFISAFISLIPAAIIWFFVSSFSGNSALSGVIAGMIFAALLILIFKYYKKNNESLSKDAAALKNLNKNTPYFIEWQETGHRNIGLTVR
ncbi:MAG: hypothetical protein LBU32_06505 [Clostridiales bacterium]|jgi:hypothetical protein|nr:hypothetical protein [Clostridiales bacterium]